MYRSKSLLFAAFTAWANLSCASDEERITKSWLQSASLTSKVSLEAWSGTRTLDDNGPLFFPLLSLNGDLRLEDGLSAHIDGLATTRSEVFGESSSHAAAREAYLSYRTGGFRVRAGEQVIAWGRADLINPTDSLSAKKYTWLLPEDGDQKVGPVTFSAEWAQEDSSIQLVWQPVFCRDEIPLPAVSGLSYVDKNPGNASDTFAAKYDVTNSDLSWSISYFQGPSKYPTLSAHEQDLATGKLNLIYPFERVYGADLEKLIGKWVVRSEAAYNQIDGSGTDVLASRSSFFLGVLGLERGFDNWSGFVQSVYRHTFDYLSTESLPSPLNTLAKGGAIIDDQYHRSLLGFGAGAAYNSSDLTKSARVDLIYFEGLGNWAIRPRLSYKFTDTITGSFGGDFYAGSDDGPVGRLRKNRLAFIRLEYGFAASR